MRYIDHARLLPLDRPLYVYGAGGRGRELLAELRELGAESSVAAFVDSSRSGEFEGHALLSLDEFAARNRANGVVVVASGAKEEIQIGLRGRGIGVDYAYAPARVSRIQIDGGQVPSDSVIPWRHMPFGRLPVTTAAGHDHYGPEGYACRDFTPRDLNIAFFGCSWTDDIPAKPSYSRVVCQRFEERYGIRVGHWNLGLTAHGNDYIARTILCGIDAIKPDIVWVTFTGMDRQEYFTLDGRLIRYQLDWVMAERQRHPNWKALAMVEKEAIGQLNRLSNPCDDTVNFIKDYKLIELSLETRGILWGFSSVTAPRNVELFPKLLDSGWLNLSRYLGNFYEFYDYFEPQPRYPGPKSTRIFGEQIFEWLVANHGGVIERIIAARAGRPVPAP